MRDRFREGELRALVAETLGVDAEELSPDVSLVDDLAADSLDLAELVVRVETELGLTISDAVVDRVRTYADFVRAAASAARAIPARPAIEPFPLRARLVSPHGEILRAEAFTPYSTETIADEARAAGRGSFLEIMLPVETTDGTVDDLRRRLAWLDAHGVVVQVAREGALRPSVAA
jgi:acyl carrier protein